MTNVFWAIRTPNIHYLVVSNRGANADIKSWKLLGFCPVGHPLAAHLLSLPPPPLPKPERMEPWAVFSSPPSLRVMG